MPFTRAEANFGNGRIVPSPAVTLAVPAIREDRPRMMFTPESLALLQERLVNREEPWSRASRTVLRDADKALGAKPKPDTGRDSYQFYRTAVRDGERARLFAYAWLSSGDDRYADAAIAHLGAWANAKPTPGSDFDPAIRFTATGMEVARCVIPFLETYDLLAEHPGLSDKDRTSIEAWFRMLVEPIRRGMQRWKENNYFKRQDYQNHLTAHVMGLAAIGYALGDRDLVQFALDHADNERDFKELIAGTILMEGDPGHHREPKRAPPPRDGEIYDRYRHYTARGRGGQYTHLSLSQILYTAELAWNNGIDFYAYTASGGENLKLPLLFYAALYRTGNLEEAGGVFASGNPAAVAHEQRVLQGRRDFPAIYEIGNRHYPGTPEIESVLKAIDRVAVPRHPHLSFFYPILTHGEPVAGDGKQAGIELISLE